MLQEKIQGKKFVFTNPGGMLQRKTIMWLDEAEGESRQLNDPRLDLANTRSVLVNKELYTFKFGSPVSACKYGDFTDVAKLVKTTLATLPYNGSLG